MQPLKGRVALVTGGGRGIGRSVNVSSGAATGSGMRYAAAYSVSKAALDMLTRAVAAEVVSPGVTVNAVYPGVVDTAMQSALRRVPDEQDGADAFARFRDLHARGELLDPERPARLITALVLSERNGEIIDIRQQPGEELLRNLPD